MTKNKESFNELEASDYFEAGALRIEVFAGLNGEWLEARMNNAEREEPFTADLTVNDARRLRDWLNRALPTGSETPVSAAGPKKNKV